MLGDLAVLIEQVNGNVTTYVYRVSLDGKKVPPGFGDQVYLEKISGPPDFDAIRERWGGGFYEVIVNGPNTKMLGKQRVSIEGDARQSPAPAPAAPPTPAPPPLDADALARVLSVSITEAMKHVIAPLVEERKPAVEDQLKQVIELARHIAQPAAGANAHETTKGMMEMLQTGITLAKRESGGGRSLGDALVEAMPQIVQVVDHVLTARNAPPPRPPVAGASPAPAAPAAPQDLSNLVLAGNVAALIAQGRPAEDLCALVELQLSDAQLDQLLQVEPGFVVAGLRRFATQFPPLAQPELDQVVAEAMRMLRAERSAPEASSESGSGPTD